MNEITLINNGVVSITKPRRSWSTSEKAAIISEAAANGVSCTAKQHGITPSLLFSWRKELTGGNRTSCDEPGSLDNLEDAYKSDLRQIRKLANVGRLLLDRLNSDLQSGRGATYNLACGFNNTISAFCKIMAMRNEIIGQLNALSSTKTPVREQYSDGVRQAAEMILVRMAKNEILSKQQQQAAQKELHHRTV